MSSDAPVPINPREALAQLSEAAGRVLDAYDSCEDIDDFGDRMSALRRAILAAGRALVKPEPADAEELAVLQAAAVLLAPDPRRSNTAFLESVQVARDLAAAVKITRLPSPGGGR